MSSKQSKSLDDVLKVLSILALLTTQVPPGYSKSVVIGAFVIIILTITYKAIFKVFYCFLVIFAIFAAVVSKEQMIIFLAILYFALGIVLFAEDERRRLGKGHFLCAIWWSGQFLIHSLNIHYLIKNFEDPDVFTIIFILISAFMVIREMVYGIRDYLKLKRQD